MDASRSLDSAKAGHTDVQNNHIRLKLLRTAHTLESISRLTYDLESWLVPKKRTDLLSDNLVVLCD